MADRDYIGEALYREGQGRWPYDGGAERTHAGFKRLAVDEAAKVAERQQDRADRARGVL